MAVWFDKDFDYNDQLARKYMKFKGEYYDVGTICKIKSSIGGPKLVRFKGWVSQHQGNRGNFELLNKEDGGLYDSYNFSGVNNYCLEIIKPVKPNLQQIETPTGKDAFRDGEKPPSWKVEVAWIWYIAIMAITVIFKERIGLWILESVVFFGWKNGIFKKSKK